MLFSLVRTAFGTVFQRQVASNDKLYRKFTAMLDVNHLFLSLLICRIVPIFPFWLVNIAPALVDFVDVFTFVLSTFIGITPGSYLYTEVYTIKYCLFSL